MDGTARVEPNPSASDNSVDYHHRPSEVWTAKFVSPWRYLWTYADVIKPTVSTTHSTTRAAIARLGPVFNPPTFDATHALYLSEHAASNASLPPVKVIPNVAYGPHPRHMMDVSATQPRLSQLTLAVRWIRCPPPADRQRWHRSTSQTRG